MAQDDRPEDGRPGEGGGSGGADPTPAVRPRGGAVEQTSPDGQHGGPAVAARAAASRGRLPPGLRERYRVTHALGAGGMGGVYAAHDQHLGREVAIKVLLKVGDPSHLERFRREAEALTRVQHPNLVQLYDFGVEDQAPWMVLERLRGEPLYQLMDEPWSPEDALALARSVARALEAIHAAGLLHRDVKPGNVVRCRDGRVVLIDLGLVEDPARPHLTGTGAVAGTAAYISPERFRLRGASPSSDFYSLGVLLYELVEGRRPFEFEAMAAAAEASGEVELPAFPVTCRRLEPLLRALLSADPDARPVTVVGMEAVLEAPGGAASGGTASGASAMGGAAPGGAASGGAATAAPPARTSGPASQGVEAAGPAPPGRGRALVAGLAAVAVAVAVGLGSRPGPDAPPASEGALSTSQAAPGPALVAPDPGPALELRRALAPLAGVRAGEPLPGLLGGQPYAAAAEATVTRYMDARSVVWWARAYRAFDAWFAAPPHPEADAQVVPALLVALVRWNVLVHLLLDPGLHESISFTQLDPDLDVGRLLRRLQIDVDVLVSRHQEVQALHERHALRVAPARREGPRFEAQALLAGMAARDPEAVSLALGGLGDTIGSWLARLGSTSMLLKDLDLVCRYQAESFHLSQARFSGAPPDEFEARPLLFGLRYLNALSLWGSECDQAGAVTPAALEAMQADLRARVERAPEAAAAVSSWAYRELGKLRILGSTDPVLHRVAEANREIRRAADQRLGAEG